MFRLGFLLLIVIGVLLAITNPGKQQHQQAVGQKLAQQSGLGETFGAAAGDMLAKADLLPLTYQNYFLFSKTTMHGRTMSIGLLTKAWPTGEVRAAAPGELPFDPSGELPFDAN